MPDVLYTIITFSFFHDKGHIIDSVPKMLNIHQVSIVTVKNHFIQFWNTFLNVAIKAKGMKVENLLVVLFKK